MDDLFKSESKSKRIKEEEVSKEELYKQIGQQKVEIDWLKKSLAYSLKEKREMIELYNDKISVRRQCKLLGLSRSSFYYKKHEESELNNKLMNEIDQEYTAKPYYGARRITAFLKRKGYSINIMLPNNCTMS